MAAENRLLGGAGPQTPPLRVAAAAAARTATNGQRGAPRMPQRATMAPAPWPGAQYAARAARA
eukprot:3108253-Lingulodinium_polyedra.AAC.1